jgi:hypothetical protein
VGFAEVAENGVFRTSSLLVVFFVQFWSFRWLLGEVRLAGVVLLTPSDPNRTQCAGQHRRFVGSFAGLSNFPPVGPGFKPTLEGGAVILKLG